MVKWRPSRGRYISRVVQAAKKVNPEKTEQAGKKLVDASKNVNRGKRARIGAAPVEPQVEQVFVPKTVTIQEPTGFKPYYIGGPNTNPVLSADQNQARLDQINRSIADLGQHLKRMENVYGIKTPTTHKAAMYRAVRTNPQTTMAPLEGELLVPYQSKMDLILTSGNPYETVEIAPFQKAPSEFKSYLSASELIKDKKTGSEIEIGRGLGFPYGPNSLWRKWYKPLRIASDKFDAIGQIHGVGGPAPEEALQQLNLGLSKMEDDINALRPTKKQGGILFAKSGIHIKKANRGKFTDYCGGKVTSKCIARGKASSNPAIRKRATFAANARKWKHQNGGKIMPFWVHNILGGE